MTGIIFVHDDSVIITIQYTCFGSNRENSRNRKSTSAEYALIEDARNGVLDTIILYSSLYIIGVYIYLYINVSTINVWMRGFENAFKASEKRRLGFLFRDSHTVSVDICEKFWISAVMSLSLSCSYSIYDVNVVNVGRKYNSLYEISY